MKCDLYFSAKDMKYRTWKFAISKCIAWQGTQFDSSFKDFVYEDKGMHDDTIFPIQFILIVNFYSTIFRS